MSKATFNHSKFSEYSSKKLQHKYIPRLEYDKNMDNKEDREEKCKEIALEEIKIEIKKLKY